MRRPGEILYFETRARKLAGPWIMAVSGAIFLAAALAAPHSAACLEGECPRWLTLTSQFLGGLFLLGGLAGLMRNPALGSAVDPSRKTLHWWVGDRSRNEHVTDLSRVTEIKLHESLDSPRIELVIPGQRIVMFDSQCVPRPWRSWAEEIRKHIPHIAVSED